ncbi:MAG TPA: amidase [Thermoanaerobaculia bacterium]|nr:amidase [Thermoanaerobaculia bacterium]
MSALLAATAPTDLTEPTALDALRRAFDEREPEVLSFVDEPGRWERLAAEAAALVERWPDPAQRPPLFGLPVGVKDIFRVDGFATRAGSAVPAEELAGPQSAAVTRLLDAGAVVIGKTVTTEFAYFAPGPTRNPAAPGRTPGGSSSGSAAAVAAGLAPVALGSQTIGSICRPAGYCSIVGFKPSYERVPREGVVPLSPSLDHVGWLAADVAIAARVAAMLCDEWRAAVVVSQRPVLGVPEGPYLERASAEGLANFRAACARLAAAGFELRPVPAMADFAEIDRLHRLLVAADAWEVHQPWFPRYGERYHAKTRELLERGRDADPSEVATASAGRAKLRGELEALMDARGIDLWISPAAPGPPPLGLEGTGDPVMNLPWTYAGVPALALPAGRDAEGLPHGVQLTARIGQDEELLAWGAVLEKAVAA